MLSPLLSGAFFGSLLAGVRDAVAPAGGSIVAIQTNDAGHGADYFGESGFVSPIAWQHVDGLITIINAVDLNFMNAIRAAGKPVTTISNEIVGLDAPGIIPDNRTGVREAVEHLIGHGHRRIAFVGNIDRPDLRERYDTYRQTLLGNGIEPDESLFFHAADNMQNGGVLAGRAMLAAGLQSTAVVAGTDYNAIGVINALTEAGVQVPRDQAVTGFDDIETGGYLMPRLTTIQQSFRRMGELAAELLLEQLAGNTVGPGPHRVPTALHLRESCGCSSVADVVPAEIDTTGNEGHRLRLLATLRQSATSHGTTDADADVVLDAAAAAVADTFEAACADDPWDSVELMRAVERIYAISPHRETVVALVSAAQDLARSLAARTGFEPGTIARLDACLRSVTIGSLDAPLGSMHRSNVRLRDALRREYAMSRELLRSHEVDPRSLSWLAPTQSSAGCIALWTTDEESSLDNPGRPLKAVGVYDPSGRSGLSIGDEFAVSAFPPRSLSDIARSNDTDVVFVLPLRTESKDWGALIIVGPIDTGSATGSETYYQWVSLLSFAMDYDGVVDTLRNQREQVAAAYQRERGLLDGIRASEERYALAARAANDGLWDWDLRRGTIYYSGRWKAMLGYADEEIGWNPNEWFDRVHADDLPGLDAVIRGRISGGAEAFEYEHRIRARDGSYRWMLCRALAVGEAGEVATRLVGSFTDVTDRKHLEDKLRHGALYDGLTGLPNRTLFLDRLGDAIAYDQRNDGLSYVVLFLDLDGFKLVNDSLGHLAGDLLLVRVAERIKRELRDLDTAARLGGDEFAVLLTHVSDLDAVPLIVRRLQRALAVPHDLNGHEVVVTASIGIASSATGYSLAEDAVRDADIAMYRAKSYDRGTFATFDVSMHQRAVTRMRLESEIRHAIDHDELELHYQPIVALGSHRVEALESLIRWRHPERGLVQPGDFLPIAEDTGLIVAVGRFVISDACRQAGEWRSAGWLRGVRISVNVSHREFWHADFRHHLVRALETFAVDPDSVNIEITEGVIMHNPETARRMLEDLRSDGLHLHVDDFGTGYSSLDALHRFPIEALKIDRSFVARLHTDRKSRELVRTIIMMGRNLGIDVIAEGIETPEQEVLLQELGCALGQGWWFARALPADRAGALLAAESGQLGIPPPQAELLPPPLVEPDEAQNKATG